MFSNVSTPSSGEILFWALNGYGVTRFDLIINIVILLLAVWIIGLNSLVLHTIVRMKMSREPADVFVCSLSLADAMSGLFLLYNTTYNLINYQLYYECAFRLGLIQVLSLTSVYHMGALTVDRYVKIVQPYHYPTVCNKLSVVVVSVVIWLISLMIGLLPLFGLQNVQETRTNGIEEPICGYFAIFNQTYLQFVVTLFWCPMLLMIVLYVHIFKIASRHARVIAAQDRHGQTLRPTERHSWKYTKTVCLIVGCYFLSWLPSGVVIMLNFSGGLGDRTTVEKGTLLLYVSSTAFINSLVNPIIYAFKITTVRLRFKALFCRTPTSPGDMGNSQTEAPGCIAPKTRATLLVTSVISEVDLSE